MSIVFKRITLPILVLSTALTFRPETSAPANSQSRSGAADQVDGGRNARAGKNTARADGDSGGIG